MFKNITVKEIAIILTCFLAGLNVFVFVLLLVTDFGIYNTTWFWVILLLVSLVSCYFVVGFFFEKFIFRKVKLIYKIINDSKVSLPSEKAQFLTDISLEDVNQEVKQWADKTQSEIVYLTDLEN